MHNLGKRLTLRYSSALAILALLLIVAYGLTHKLLNDQLYDGKIINIAGRQRMLSQKIAKEALAMQRAESADDWKEHRQALATASSIFWEAHNNLIGNTHTMGFVSIHSPKIDSLSQQAEIHLLQIKQASQKLLKISFSQDQLTIIPNPVASLINGEKAFLPLMDQLVSAYEEASQIHTKRIRNWQLIILLSSLALILLSAFLIFKPMVEKIVFEQNTIQEINEGLRASEEELREYNATLENTQEELRAKQEELERNERKLQEYIQEVDKSNIQLQSSYAELKASENRLQEQKEQLKQQQEVTYMANQALEDNQEKLMRLVQQLKESEGNLQQKTDYIELSLKNAKNIQASILPPKEEIRKALPNHCLLYLPKATVSGDFYWISKHGEQALIGVVDCTGHGISGAFISLLGYSVLRQIVFEQNCIDPASILEKLNKGIAAYFRQREHRGNYGMDAGFCLLDESDFGAPKLTFAGAKNRLFLIQNGQISSTKGDLASLGGYYATKDISFKNTIYTLEPGDTVYMATDGFIDQGNINNRKLGRKAFMDLLQEIHREPIYAQSSRLSNCFEQYKGDNEQRDDVTVLGFRV